MMFIRSKFEENKTETRNGFRYNRTHNAPLNSNYIVSLSVADSSLDTGEYPCRIEFVLNDNKTAVWVYEIKDDRVSEYEWIMSVLDCKVNDDRDETKHGDAKKHTHGENAPHRKASRSIH